MIEKNISEKGATLFIALVTASIVLAMGLSILQITLKDFLLSGTVRDSERAFVAADLGMECSAYWDQHITGSYFNKTTAATIRCINGGGDITVTPVVIGTTPRSFEVNWVSAGLCAKVDVYKYDTGTSLGRKRACPVGVPICTEIISRGYNRPCTELSNPRTVERALQANY